MKDKKRFIIFTILAALSLALVVTMLFVPLVHIVARTTDALKIKVLDKTYNFLDYLKQDPFVTTFATDTYFNSSGPVWLSGFALMCNYFFLVFGIVLFAASVFELIATPFKNINAKQNNFAKHIALVVGYFGIFVAIYQLVAYYTTTAMAKGYAEFNPNAQCFIVLAICIAIVIFAHISGKTRFEQKQSKLKNAFGFGLTAVFTALSYAFVFIPQYSKYFLSGKPSSFWHYGANANKYVPATMTGGDYPLGISFYIMVVLGLIALFVFVVCVIGFIRALMGKKTNWLSTRAKKWSLIFAVAYMVLYMFEFAIISNILSTVKFEDISIILPIAYFAIFLPFVTMATSAIMPREKRKNKK